MENTSFCTQYCDFRVEASAKYESYITGALKFLA